MNGARTYLDYNATAPLRREAREAMLAALDVTGNASSVHAEGRKVRAIVETAREQVAALVNARPAEVVFTSGATEANNWALLGYDTVIVSAIEHDSVLAPARSGVMKLIDLAVDGSGRIDPAPLAGCLARLSKPAAALAVAQMANNETGVMQDLAKLTGLAAQSGVRVHTDAVQAAGRVSVDFRRLGAATMSLSAHKMGGPKGIGALVIRDGVAHPAMIKGGGQERRRRSGTENVAAIAGFGATADVARRTMDDWARVARLRDDLEARLAATTPNSFVVGAGADRLPNTTCIAVPGHPAETLVIKLDLAGMAVSAGAACSSGKVGASATLTAMALDAEIARSAIRVSLGPQTTANDTAAFLAAWTKIMNRAAIAA